MWYVIAVIWLALIAGIVWAYRRKREKNATVRAKQMDALLSEARHKALTANAAGATSPVAAVIAAPAPVTEFGRKPRLMPQADALLYFVFRTGLPDHEIFANLSLADLVEVAPAIRGYEREQKMRKLSQHKIDLLICTRQLDVAAVVVIDRSEATEPAHAANARFVEACLKAVGIRLVRIDAATPPRHHQVRNLVYDVAPGGAENHLV